MKKTKLEIEKPCRTPAGWQVDVSRGGLTVARFFSVSEGDVMKAASIYTRAVRRERLLEAAS